MIYEESLIIKIKINKKLIVDFYENCLKTVVLKELEDLPAIDCSTQNSRVRDLTFEEFKREFSYKTIIEDFSMVMRNKVKKIDEEYTVILISKVLNDGIRVTLKSHDKIWIDDNIVMLEHYFDEYKKGNANKEEIANKKEKGPWQRADIKIGIISIIVTIIIAILGWTVFKK